MAVFNYIPDTTTRGRRKPRVLKAQFGDGYEQRLVDGLNPNLSIWTLQFRTLTLTELGAIDTFLKGQNGATKFQWTPPNPFNSAALWFICEDWEWTYDNGTIVGLQAIFQERPEL